MTMQYELLRWLNSQVAQSPASFYQALDWTQHNIWIVAALVTSGFWFYGEAGAFPSAPRKITRLESRRRIILTFMALALALGLGLLLQQALFHPRPLVDAPLQIPIEPEVWRAIRADLATQSGFPDFLAVMLFALATLIFSLHRWIGVVAGLVGGYLCVWQVGLGFHWPVDELAGALLGILITALMLVSQPLWRWFLNPLVLLFEARQALVYPLGFLIVLDFSQKFAGLSSVWEWLQYYATGF